MPNRSATLPLLPANGVAIGVEGEPEAAIVQPQIYQYAFAPGSVESRP